MGLLHGDADYGGYPVTNGGNDVDGRDGPVRMGIIPMEALKVDHIFHLVGDFNGNPGFCQGRSSPQPPMLRPAISCTSTAAPSS